MSYKNIVNHGAANKKESFQRIRDFLCSRNGTYDYTGLGPGWTLHDSSYAVDEDTISANDWIVLYSDGEDTKADLYVLIKYISTANYITVNGYLSWDNSAHTGIHRMSTSVSTWYIHETSPNIWVYADKDFISIVSNNGTTDNIWYTGWYGRLLDTYYDSTVAISSAAASSGGGVPITVDAVPDSWEVGRWVTVRDDDNIKRTAITDITGSVVSMNLADDMAAGFKLAEVYEVVQTITGTIITPAILYGHAGGYAQGCVAGNYFSVMASNGDPEPWLNEVFAFPFYITDTISGNIGSPPFWMCGAGVTNFDVLTTAEGVNYRKFYCSGYNILFKEV